MRPSDKVDGFRLFDEMYREACEQTRKLLLNAEPEPDDYIVMPRPASDGRSVSISPIGAGQAVLGIGPPGLGVYDNCWYYETPREAVLALELWDPRTEPEPKGWWRNPSTGRRRPGGDPAKEYIQW
jgi:hypothetical protein